MRIEDLIKKSRDGERLSRRELAFLLSLPPDSPASYLTMAEAKKISRGLTANRAEVHAQLALNMGPCAGNCGFCSFASSNGIFKAETRLTPEQAVAYAKQFETDGASAVYVMTTAQYPFGLFLEMSREIRRSLRPGTVMIANVGDQQAQAAAEIRLAGYSGVYHALRLREGTDTVLTPEARKSSIMNFQEAGLTVGTCVEPIGPEHSNEELADAIAFTASFPAAFSGAARRIAIPGTPMAARGMISELRMAQIVAVTRLGVPATVQGNCTHEPCALGAAAGASLFWAESGANPRDTRERTEEGRGETVENCRRIFSEGGWDVWNSSSRYFRGRDLLREPRKTVKRKPKPPVFTGTVGG